MADFSGPNPALRRLGLNDTDRVVILHADDIGMCGATVSAYRDLLDFGLLSSAAVMVPCPWFPATAALCRADSRADMGVHVTVTCEWDSYRWGPVASRDAATGLLDAEGYFHRTSEATWDHADPAAVAAEIDAQVARARVAGVDITHIDNHMGTVIRHPLFCDAYIGAARAARVPVMHFRTTQAEIEAEGIPPADAARIHQTLLALEEEGFPLIDDIRGMPLHGEKTLELAQSLLTDLRPGITHFILHPAHDTPELRAIAPDWRARTADFELFTSPALRDFIHDQGIHVIGYRTLREII